MDDLKKLYQIQNLFFDLKESPENEVYRDQMANLLLYFLSVYNEKDDFVASQIGTVWSMVDSKKYIDTLIEEFIAYVFSMVMFENINKTKK